jgi:hypothetical protein
MPVSVQILPLDIDEFLQATSGQTAENALAYLHMQINYLRHGPIKNTPEAVAASMRPPRKITSLSMHAWSIDAQTSNWHHSSLDAWIAKHKKTRKKAVKAASIRWGKNAHAPSIDAQSIDTPSIDAQKILDTICPDAKALKRREQARKAANCRWSRSTSENSAKVEHIFMQNCPPKLTPPPSDSYYKTFTPKQKESALFAFAGDDPNRRFFSFSLLDGQHRICPVGVYKAKPSNSARRSLAEILEDIDDQPKAKNAVARRVRGKKRHPRKVSTAKSEVFSEERLKPLRDEVWEYWTGCNKILGPDGTVSRVSPRCPWGPGEDMALNSLVRECPDIDRAMLKRMLVNRSGSEGVNHSERPAKWLHDVVRYWAYSLDRYGKQKVQQRW